jgi:diacylglycerol kinase (ATP)
VPPRPTDRFGLVTLLADPSAGGGTLGRRLPEIEAAIRGLGLELRTERLRGGQRAGTPVRRALEAGERFIVLAGGDDEVHDAVAGMMEGGRPLAQDAVFGMLAAGPRSDFAKTFGLPEDPVKGVQHLAGETVYEMDVASVSATDRRGRPAQAYMWNLAEVGLGGATSARAARFRPFLRGASYFTGFWLSVATARRPRVHIHGDRKELEVVAANVVVGNCQFQRDVKLSPRSWPGDGFLDVLAFTGPRSDAFRLLPKMFYGEHVPHPNIIERRARRVRIESDRPVRVQVDERPLGFTPVTFDVIPRAIRVKL